MIVAVVGSRTLTVTDEQIAAALPAGVTGIVSGGAIGIDACARRYAMANGIGLIELPPDYRRCGRGAPLVRNREIVEIADAVVAFWDGVSHGTKHVIDLCRAAEKPLSLTLLSPAPPQNTP